MDSPKSDEALLAEFVSGRKAALGELASRYERPLLGLARGLLRGRGDLAQDAVQETWVRVIRFGGRFNGRSRFKTWLYRIAVNQCHTLSNSAAGGVGAAVGRSATAQDAERLDRPEQVAESTERCAVLRRAVDELTEDQRMVLLLCYHEGMTHGEAAELLEIPVGTLKSRLNAALNELRARLPVEMKP